MLVSLGEISMQQPVKQIRRRLLKCLSQLPVGGVSLGHGHLVGLVAVDDAGPSSGNAQAEDEAHCDDEQCPPKVNHLPILAGGLLREVLISGLLLSLGALQKSSL